MTTSRSLIRAAALCVAASWGIFPGAAQAQQPQTMRIRGTIAAIDGNALAIQARDGRTFDVKFAEGGRVFAFVPAALADIKPNSYIGVTAMPQPDGSQMALAIHIFMESQRGAGEGHRPWDLQPNSTMTNGVVDTTVSGVQGEELMLKYKDGEKKVIVTPQTQIVAIALGDRSELQPGAPVNFSAQRQADGTLIAPTISVGRGVVPPM